jgi:hypothetical protein
LGLWYEAATNTLQDAAAASRMNDFHIGWLVLVVFWSAEKLSSTMSSKHNLVVSSNALAGQVHVSFGVW